MFKNALVSVSNKNGLVEFLRPFVASGLRVVSTGGTYKHLKENGIPVVDVSEQTHFPEVMDGRVKTLHPMVHMALLARQDHPEDTELLKKNGLEPFDLVIVNLYPFEEKKSAGLTGDELVEYIDIGGPSMLRAAAKNHQRVAVVCEPEDYQWIADKRELTLQDRRKLAAKVYAHTARYDALIAQTLDPDLASHHMLAGNLVQELRYGENPQQKAWWFRNPCERGWHDAKILHGKALSYNNLLDLEAAAASLRSFNEPCAVVVKHNNPCGVGLGDSADDIDMAIDRALRADPMSAFGGIVALNRELDFAGAKFLSKLFLECIVAPGFSPEAMPVLQAKKDLRLLCWPQLGKEMRTDSDANANANAEPKSAVSEKSTVYEFRSIAGGYLIQTSDQVEEWQSSFKIFGETPSNEIKKNLLLAWRVCASLKSNAIAIAVNSHTVGLGMGQVNRVDAVEQAIARMQVHHANLLTDTNREQIVLASDAFFPFADSIEKIAAAGIRWVIQPGGSIKDDLVIERAQQLKVNLVLTGVRHFRH